MIRTACKPVEKEAGPIGRLKPYYENESGRLYCGDALKVLETLPDKSVNCCVTSPAYWGLRDYGVDGQLGLEQTPEEYVSKMVDIFREVRRVLRDDGTLWLNLGDSYASNPKSGGVGQQGGGEHQRTPKSKKYIRPNGYKPKDLIGIPWRVAFALQADGWYLRQDIIWHKPNPMPESVRDRCTKAHEYVFLMSKSQKYWYDADAIAEKSIERIRLREKNNGESAVDTKTRGYDGFCGNNGKRNRRSVWTCPTHPFPAAHFATFPPALIEPCILAGCPARGTVLDPFIGSGTTAIVAYKHDRKFIGIDLSEKYLSEIAIPRIEHERQQLKLF